MARLEYLDQRLQHTLRDVDCACVVLRLDELQGHLLEKLVKLSGSDYVWSRDKFGQQNSCAVANLAWIDAVRAPDVDDTLDEDLLRALRVYCGQVKGYQYND